MNVYIIGAGASGLTSAIILARRGFKVHVIEQNKKVGKKLLLTGNGRCNYWNEDQSLEKYHSNNIDMVKIILSKSKDLVLPFFDSIGIVPKIINGYYYPFTNQAISVVNALFNTAKNLNVNFIYEEKVKDIVCSSNFTIITDKNSYKAEAVILATGSKAMPKTGSDGNGYELAKKLGYNITKIYPSLVPIIGESKYLKDLEGVRSNVILNLIVDDNLVKQEMGEVQFTNLGISGICSFNLSGEVNQYLNEKKKVEIGINLVPWFKQDKKALIKYLDEAEERLINYSLSNILEGFLNYKIVNVILKILNIDTNTKWENVIKEKVVNLLLDFRIKISGTKDYDYSQVCRGGISLKEINPETMESRKIKNLYIVGELLDVDGDCGGYNLGFAWMSGLIAGESVSKEK